MATKVKTKIKHSKLKCLIGILLLSLVACYLMPIVGAETQTDWNLNLNVQKTDTQEKESFFSPFDQLMLTANLTAKNQPQANTIVSFLIEGPLNKTNQITQVRNIKTNADGIAELTFRLPMEQKDTQVVGTWKVSASAQTLTEKAVTSNTTFNVQWAIEISDIQFINTEETPTNTSLNELTAQISLKNLDSHSRNLNITGNIKDLNNNSIAEFGIENFMLANNSTDTINKKIQIPKETLAGEATAEFNVYSGRYQNTDIQVAETKKTPLTITANSNNQTDNQTSQNRDIAVLSANVSTKRATIGEKIDITTTIANKGEKTETFMLTVNSNEGQISNMTTTLEASTQKDLTLTWDTTNNDKGTYAITIQLDHLQGETNLDDNQMTAGTVTLDYPAIFPQATSLFVLVLVFAGILTFTTLLFFVKKARSKLTAAALPI